MKHLLFSALIGCMPSKEKQKEPIVIKTAFMTDERRNRVVKTILNKRGKIVDTNYKGLVYLIYEDFAVEKSIFN